MHGSSSPFSSSSLEQFSLEPWKKRDGENLTLKGIVLGEEKPRDTKMNKNEVCLAFKCPNFRPLCLNEGASMWKDARGFALAKDLYLIELEGMPNGALGSP